VSDAHQGLADLSHQILAAILHRDRAALDAVLHPGFVQINEAGVRTNRTAFIEAVCENDLDILDASFDSLSIEVFDQIGIAAGVQRGRVRMANGDVVTGRTAFTDVFIRQGSGWLLRAATSADLQ
jgi:hypothetical protein